jgi:lipoprotein-releasing system ATP-binding protein
MSEILLSARGLSKVYTEGPRRVEVLQSVDLDLHAGECVAIVGSSGSGKSTLLHLLGGLDQPSAGQLEVQGRNWLQLGEVERTRLRNQLLGFVYQFHHLLPEFTALENVAMPLLLRGQGVKTVHEAAAKQLEAVGLRARLQHKPAELSGGERQRVAIARALVGQPACVLADEPTGNLDRLNADKVFSLLLERAQDQGVAVLLVTHDTQLAAKAHRCLHLVDGRIEYPAKG